MRSRLESEFPLTIPFHSITKNVLAIRKITNFKVNELPFVSLIFTNSQLENVI